MKNLPLATTDKGREFVMKALHPADHEIKATRVPGGIDNTVALQIDQIFDYHLDHDDTRMILAPILDTPVMFEYRDDDDDLNYWHADASFQPPVFGGSGLVSMDDATSLMGTIREQFESFCITSESATLEFIAPALTNQGTILAAQFPMEPEHYYLYTGNHYWASDDEMSFSNAACLFDNYPFKERLLSGTRAYNAKLTQGCYMPLRLSNFDQHYVNRLYSYGFAQPGQASVQGANIPRGTVSGIGYAASRVGMGTHEARLMPTSSTWGIMYLDGYEKGTSVRVRFRMTIEGRVFPGSSFAPLAEPPPLPDDTAMKMYREIAGRLVNAYPASYNDWNKLKGSVLTLAKGLLENVAPWVKSAVKGLPFGGAIATLTDPLVDGATKWVASKMTPAVTVTKPVPKVQTVVVTKSKARRMRRQARKAAATAATVQTRPKITIIRPQRT